MKNFLFFTVFTYLFSCNKLLAQTESSYESDPNIEEVTIESDETDCTRSRLDIWEYDSDQREAIKDCIVNYLNTAVNPNWESGDPLQEQNFIILEHFENKTLNIKNTSAFYYLGRSICF